MRLAARLEKAIYRASDAVTGQAPGIVEAVRGLLPSATVSLVPNGVDCMLFSPERRDRSVLARFGCDGKLVVAYAGLIGVAQGMRKEAETVFRSQTERMLNTLDLVKRDQITREVALDAAQDPKDLEARL